MNRTQSKFEGLLSEYFETLLKDSPAYACVSGGLREFEGKLGEWSVEFNHRRQRERERTIRKLDEISPRDLSGEQHLDRLALRSQLLREMEDHARGRPQMEPSGPDQVLNLLLHELMRGDDEPDRASRNLSSLLKQIPDFLEQAEKLVEKPDPVWVRLMEQTIKGAPVLFAAIQAFLQVNHGYERDAGSARRAETAIREYGEAVQARPKGPAGGYAIGSVALERRVRDELGLDYSLGQIESLALHEISRIGELLKQAAGRKSPAKMVAEFRDHWKPSRPLIDLYRQSTATIAAGFKSARAVTFPRHEELAIKPVPEFLRTVVPTAAYSQPGAFDSRQRGIFWVNDLSVIRKTAAETLAEQQQHFGIPLTCAHEGYPGHHLQFVTANHHPRKWRRLFSHAIFYEGWTLWCEQMMVDLRIDRSPWLKLQQLHDALWRCHRILVDLRLQTHRYSYNEAVRHLQKHLGFTRARAEADVNWYVGSPGVPMSYWLGRLENERLHACLVVGKGWSLKKFNDWLLSFGTLPQSWILKYGNPGL